MNNSSKSNYKDNYVQFGNSISLNYKKLHDNILLIKYSKSFGPTKLKSTKISDNLKQFILEIIETEKLNVNFQKKLDIDDVKLFEKLIDICRLRTFLKYKKYIPSIDDQIERFNLLRAGFFAGNHSYETRQEIISLLNILSNANKISKSDADEFIQILA